MHVPPMRRQAFWSFRFDVLGVKPVTGAGLGLELRPELTDLKPLGDAPPEIMHPHAERIGLAGLRSGRGGGHHCSEAIIEELGSWTVLQTGSGKDLSGKQATRQIPPTSTSEMHKAPI